MLMSLNRTLRQLQNARDRRDPEMYDYVPETSEPPAGVRYMTLAEAQSLE